ncbi:hypothetical protein ACHIPZ_13775 [Antrihabitans sp. NCIMB 15449]|uniref:Uncharacterized protein n=1 Tax=Antrihabitans spumae TaxID=3373370 RepID=A0ABW7JMM6_9NOCA
MTAKEPGRKSAKRVPNKTILEERRFKPPKGFEESKGMPGVYMNADYRAYMQNMLGLKVEDAKAAAEVSPMVKAMADELSTIHLPEWVRGGRRIAEPTRFTIEQSVRLAQYLVDDRGWSQNLDDERLRWVPTPNAGPGDMGIHIERNDDGTWPTPDPEDFYDIEKIIMSKSQTGWIAAHPCGVKAEATSKAQAHADASQKLLSMIEIAKTLNEKEASTDDEA